MKAEMAAGPIVRTTTCPANNRVGLGRRLPFLLVFGISSFLLPASFAADAPAAINYQGALLDNLGNAVSAGTYRVAFRIWDDPTDKGALDLVWGREFPVNVMTGGLFNALLTDSGDEVSDPTPQTNDLREAFGDEDRYLGLTVMETPGGAVSGPDEIPTRQQMVSAGFAIFSVNTTDAEQAPAGFRVENGLVVETGGITVSGAVQVHEDLEVDGAATLGQSLQVLDTSTVDGTADLHGLHVHSGGSQFDSSMAVAGDLTVASSGTLAGYGTAPVGGIVMWDGPTNTIPTGWALCDGGTHHGHATPDLRDLFLAGAGGDYTVGATGGLARVTLSWNEMPEHSHGYTTKNEIYAYKHDEGDNHGYWKHTDDNGESTGTTGGDQPHENRPPYVALYYIMRVQ